MDWMRLQDPENPENRNAGNGGDLVKHTIYLATLQYLLRLHPWSKRLRVRECHAGRGMYAIAAGDSRRPLLECLFSPVNSNVGVVLHDLQLASQAALAVWPRDPSQLGWYTGSAVLNAWCLGATAEGDHQLELYEFAPDTRRVLRALLATPALKSPRVDVRILPEPEDESTFDGEMEIENNVESWNSQDLIVMDPFAMWRQDQDRFRRQHYRRVVDSIVAKGQDSPLLVLFWMWGRAFPVADGDLQGTNLPVENGYQELRERLHRGRRRFVRVSWRWGLQFAMWVLVPESHLNALCAALQRECDATWNHLVSSGCGGRLANPRVEVTIDES